MVSIDRTPRGAGGLHRGVLTGLDGVRLGGAVGHAGDHAADGGHLVPGGEVDEHALVGGLRQHATEGLHGVEQVVHLDVDDVARDAVRLEHRPDVVTLGRGPHRVGEVAEQDDPVGPVVERRLDDPVVFDAERRDVDQLGASRPIPPEPTTWPVIMVDEGASGTDADGRHIESGASTPRTSRAFAIAWRAAATSASRAAAVSRSSAVRTGHSR
jgi:hypothetical protein